MKDVMERAPHVKDLIDMYIGPNVVAAKQQKKRSCKRVATLVENIPNLVKWFNDKT
jgi:hypothetical protein